MKILIELASMQWQSRASESGSGNQNFGEWVVHACHETVTYPASR